MQEEDILLIRMLSADTGINTKTSVQWSTFSNRGERSNDVYSTPLEMLKDQWYQLQDDECITQNTIPDKVILFLAGHLTINRVKKLTHGQVKHFNSALPYIIEESLAENIDDIHIASHLQKKNNKASLVAIPHVLIKNILSLFENVAFIPNLIYSECELITPDLDTASLVLDHDHVIMATPSHPSLALPYDAVPFALSQRIEDFEKQGHELECITDSRISQVELIHPNTHGSTTNKNIEVLKDWLNDHSWLYKEQHLNNSVFELMADKYFQHKNPIELINLRQGPYRCSKRASQKMARWRPVIGLAACWIVIELFTLIGQGLYFGHEANKIWDQSADLYLTIFPHDRQIRDAKARHQRIFNFQTWLTNRLKFSHKKDTHNNEFLSLLQQLSAVIAEQGSTAAIVPQHVNFNSESRRLTLEFLASNLEAVNKLEASLKAKGLQTRLDSAHQDKKGVIAKMIVAR